MEKDKNAVKIVFIGNYIYADHTYKVLPEYQTKELTLKGLDWPAKTVDKFDEVVVPNSITREGEDLKMIG